MNFCCTSLVKEGCCLVTINNINLIDSEPNNISGFTSLSYKQSSNEYL